jgi:hypothetical protein
MTMCSSIRTFKEFNRAGDPCPICGTYDNRSEVVLIPVAGPISEESNICRAAQVHLSCLVGSSVYYEGEGSITWTK